MAVDPAIIEAMHAEMLSRVPAYEQAKKAINAHISAAERGCLFAGLPVALAPAVEDRCKKVVIRELKKCIKEIDEHLKRLAEIPRG